jgi:hypothetical protein
MKRLTDRRVLGSLLVIAAIGVAGGWLATRVRANGVPPTPGSIYYAGEISRTDASAIEPTLDFTITLWDDRTAGTMLCSVGPATATIAAGHFRVPLDPAGNRSCLDALHANPVVWIQLQVAGTATEILPRTQIGAVPYALEADRAAQVTRSTGGAPIGVAGTVCGFTAITNGSFSYAGHTGIGAARALCQTVSGCSATAHMCTASEAAISRQLGPLAIPINARAWVTGGAAGCSSVPFPYHEWSSSVSTNSGTTTDEDSPATSTCEAMHPIACCD